MRLAAPTPAARPGGGTPGGCGPPRLLSAQRGDCAARLDPGTALPGTPDPGGSEGPRRARGHPESARHGPPSPAFLLSFRRLETRLPFRALPARPGREARPTPHRERSQKPGPRPGSSDSALCSVPRRAVSAVRRTIGPEPDRAKESWLGRHPLVGAGLSLPIGKATHCGRLSSS